MRVTKTNTLLLAIYSPFTKSQFDWPFFAFGFVFLKIVIFFGPYNCSFHYVFSKEKTLSNELNSRQRPGSCFTQNRILVIYFNSLSGYGASRYAVPRCTSMSAIVNKIIFLKKSDRNLRILAQIKDTIYSEFEEISQ